MTSGFAVGERALALTVLFRVGAAVAFTFEREREGREETIMAESKGPFRCADMSCMYGWTDAFYALCHDIGMWWHGVRSLSRASLELELDENK